MVLPQIKSNKNVLCKDFLGPSNKSKCRFHLLKCFAVVWWLWFVLVPGGRHFGAGGVREGTCPWHHRKVLLTVTVDTIRKYGGIVFPRGKPKKTWLIRRCTWRVRKCQFLAVVVKSYAQHVLILHPSAGVWVRDRGASAQVNTGTQSLDQGEEELRAGYVKGKHEEFGGEGE